MDTAKVLLFLSVVSSCRCAAAPSNVGIFGGHEIAIEQAPFMAQLRLSEKFLCGGTIIHESFILTAAHCFYYYINSNQTFDIIVGTNSRDNETDGQIYEIEDYVIHKNYVAKVEEFDVALAKLSTPIEFGEKVNVVKLANSSAQLTTGTMLNVTGWGLAEKSLPEKLLQTTIPVVDQGKCQKVYDGNFNITSNEICAGGVDERSACYGDSGGPLSAGDVQVGIVSFGENCWSVPTVYTKVSAVYEWIQNHMRSML